jgi:asparagine synthase (glutamine-hydrolysing)
MPSAEAALSGRWRPGQAVPLAVVADGWDAAGAPLSGRSAPEVGSWRGSFVAAWTDAAGDLHLARDLLGHRSLFWGRAPDGGVVWSTRLADVAAVVGGELDELALLTWLSTAYVPGTATLLRAVRAVGGGEELVFSGREVRSRAFASLPASPSQWDADDVLLYELRSTLEAAVERRLPEGAVAATLSGGIDSSLVVALARRRRAVHCLSVSFGREHRNELEFSAAVAKHTGASHQVVEVNEAAVRDRFDAAIGALSEPNGDPLTVPNLLLFEAAAAGGYGVVLNGEGGDPSFGGPKNAPMLLAQLYGGAEGPGSAERDYLRAHQRLWDELGVAVEPALRERVGDGAVEALVTPWLTDPRWPGQLDRLMALNVAWKGAGHILPKVEQLSRRSGVLARSPLFDREVVELAFRIPGRLKRNGPVEKYLLKEAVRELLPAAVVDRPKSGMMVPVEAWLQGPLRAWARERLMDGLAPRRLLRHDWLDDLSSGRLGGLRPRIGVKVWMLLTLESWLRQVVDPTRAVRRDREG